MGWEWLISVVIIPIGIGIFKLWSKQHNNLNDMIDQLELRLQKAELKIAVLDDDVEEIKTIRDELIKARVDIGVIKNILQSNESKGA